jgi:hypothetical protein
MQNSSQKGYGTRNRQGGPKGTKDDQLEGYIRPSNKRRKIVHKNST